MDIAEFLLARIAEDEAVAQDAADECARHDRDFEVEDPDWQRWSRPAASVASTGPIAQFINRQDPLRVLAECEAKRQIVERLADLGAHFADTGRQMPDMRSAVLVDGILADLALPYGGHPDYRQEWKP